MTRLDPPIRLLPWVCGICWVSWLVSGDADRDEGWDRVREHRAEHKSVKKGAAA